MSKTKIVNGIKVTVVIPESIPKYLKDEKINFLYEMLKERCYEENNKNLSARFSVDRFK